MSRSNVRPLLKSIAAAAMGAGLVVSAAAVSTAGAAVTPKSTPGVTATSITIGATVPLTGIASNGYNQVAKAANAVFKWVNAKGGINHRKINFHIIDDCYAVGGSGCKGNPNESQDTQSLINLPVFATVGSLGTPTQAPMRSVLNNAKVPQLFVNSGAIDWNCGVKYTKNTTQYSPYESCGGTASKPQPVYPNLFGWQQSYQTESMILAQYVKANYAGQKVCFLGQSDDFGHGGEVGLTYAGLTPSVVSYYNVALLAIGQTSTVKTPIDNFQSASCKVVVLDTIPGATAVALGEAATKGFSPHWVISSVGSDPVTVANLLSGAPLEVGAISFAELPASTDTNPWNAWMYKVLEADSCNSCDFPGFSASTPLNGNMAYGIGWGVSFVEALKAAGASFTRTSFVSTLLKTSFQTPALTLLKYSTANHQGLQGGYVTEIKSITQTEPAPGVDGNKAVYVTPGTKGSKITKSTKLSTSVPSWLQ